MLDLIIGGTLALAGVVVLVLAALLVSHRPPIGFALIGTALVLGMDFPIWPTLVTVAGFSVTFADLSAALLTLAALITLGRRTGPFAFSIGLPGVVGALILVSVATGIPVHGLGAAVNEARGMLLIFAVCLWIFALQPSRPDVRRWIERWAIWSGVVVFARGLYVITTQGLGNRGTRVVSAEGEVLVAGRPMAATQALLLAFAAFVAISIWRSSGKSRYAILGLAFFTMVVLAQHRSVWAATIAGAVWYIASLDIARRLVTIVIALVCGGVLVGLASWIDESSVLHLLTESATSTGTYEGRLYDWEVLIDRSIRAGPATVVFGVPYGEGWLRYRPDGLPLEYAPHNIYVSSYLRIGIVGLLAIVLLAIRSLGRASRLRNDPPLGALLVVILVYCWAYNFTWLLAPILGWAIWGTTRPTPDPEPDPGRTAKRHLAKRTRGSVSRRQ